MEYSIRLAQPSDSDGIVQVTNWAYRGGKEKKSLFQEEHLIEGSRLDHHSLQKIFSAPHYSTSQGPSIFVMLDSKQTLVGCIKIDCSENPTEAELGLFAVDPDLGGQGLGTRLFKHALNIATSDFKKQTAVLWVLTCRKDILDWYGRLGFVQTSKRTAFPPPEAMCGVPKPGETLEFVCLNKNLIE